jgi:hypothetical protein
MISKGEPDLKSTAALKLLLGVWACFTMNNSNGCEGFLLKIMVSQLINPTQRVAQLVM